MSFRDLKSNSFLKFSKVSLRKNKNFGQPFCVASVCNDLLSNKCDSSEQRHSSLLLLFYNAWPTKRKAGHIKVSRDKRGNLVKDELVLIDTEGSTLEIETGLSDDSRFGKTMR